MKVNELDFRVWDDNKKKYLTQAFGVGIMKGMVGGVEVNVFSLCGYDNDGGADNSHAEIELYTGIRDMKDKKIYVGDIVKNYDYDGDEDILEVAVVEFELDSGCYATDGKRRWSLWGLDNLKVIGNIHENPNLLEEAK